MCVCVWGGGSGLCNKARGLSCEMNLGMRNRRKEKRKGERTQAHKGRGRGNTERRGERRQTDTVREGGHLTV